jgi:hypothetical protein
MTILKALTLAGALLAGGTTLVLAQNGPPTGGQPSMQSAAPGTRVAHPTRHQTRMYMQSGSTAANAAASGGSGTHKGAIKSGSAASNQKVLQNQNGYR